MKPAQRRALAWQVLRKSTQFFSVGFVVYAAVSMHWRNFKVAHNSERIVGLMTNETNAKLYGINEDFLSLFGEPLAVSDGMLGGPWAATAAGLPLTDPWAVMALLASGAAPPMAMVAGALFPLVLAALLGKVFCSFLCPARVGFELSSAIRRGLARIGLPMMQVRLPRIGLWVGLAALLFSASAGPAIFTFVLPYVAVHTSITAWFTTGAVMVMVGWFGLLWLVDLMLAPGQVCHALCPTGALLETFARRPALRLERRGGECPPSCDVCQRACPYGLFPGRKTHLPACDSCAKCAVVCPQGKLETRMRLPGKAAAAAMLAGSLVAQPSHAHHNKGLPHYGYFDNYPQVPTEEFIDEIGRWEAGAVFFNFQGMDRSKSDTPDDVRIFAYLYDLQDDRGYKGELTVQVTELDGSHIATYDRMEADQEGVYVFRQTMPYSGEFLLHFQFDHDGESHDVPLTVEVDLSVGGVPWALILGATGVLVLLFGVAAVGRRDKAARRAAPAFEASHGP
jgi:ferredoxin-type protein NapH